MCYDRPVNPSISFLQSELHKSEHLEFLMWILWSIEEKYHPKQGFSYFLPCHMLGKILYITTQRKQTCRYSWSISTDLHPPTNQLWIKSLIYTVYLIYFINVTVYIYTQACVKKNFTQHESYQLNFIWSKMRTAAWETAFQRAQRNCSEEVREGARIHRSSATKDR